MLIKRLITVLCPLAIALGLEALFYISLNLQAIIALLLFLFVILLICLKSLIAEKIRTRNFWGLASLPILFYILATNYVLILGLGFLSHVVIVLFALVLFAFLENLFLFYYHRASYQVNSLENSAAFLNILLFFLLVLDLNALSVLLSLPLWILSLGLISVLFVLLWQLFWIFKIRNKIKILYLLLIVMLILEFFWALSFLPTNFYVLAALLTLIYYFILGVFRTKMAEELNQKIFLRYALISAALIFIILITSHWI